MNKQALKLKKKRRAAKEKEKNEKMKDILEEVNRYADSKNLPRMKNDRVTLETMYKATQHIDNKILIMSGVVSLTCFIHTLGIDYNYDTEILLKHAKRLQKFIKLVVSADRPIHKLIDEIEYDFNVNILDKCKDLPKLGDVDISKYNMDEMIIKSTNTNYPYMLVLMIYNIAYDSQWTAQNVNDFVDIMNTKCLNILNDTSTLEVYKNEILSSCKVDINLTNGVVKEII